MSINSQIQEQIERTLLELGFTYSYWFPEKPKTALIHEHIAPLRVSLLQQVDQGVNFAELDALPWEQIENYIFEFLIPEFNECNQNTINACGVLMASIYRAIQSRMALSDGNEELALRRVCQATHFCGMVRGLGNEHQDIKSIASMLGARGAKAKLENDPKQSEKLFIRECWEAWQQKPGSYKGKAEFARDMLKKCEHLTSQKKIEDWCRDWEATNRTLPAK